MGLDSVELLLTVEEYFGISIPARVAEKIYTIKDFATAVAQEIKMNSNSKCKSQLLFYRLRTYCSTELGQKLEMFTLNTQLWEFIPEENRLEVWEKMSNDLNLLLPELKKTDFKNSKYSFKERILAPRPTIMNHTITSLVDWILVLNYKSLISVNEIFTINEIEKIIMGIICEYIGVDVLEIKPHHRFLDEYGIS